MERRMLLAIVLSFLAVTVYGSITGTGFMAPPEPEKPAEENGAENGQPGGAPKGATDGAGGAVKPPVPPPGKDDPQPGVPGANGAPAPAPVQDLANHPQRKTPASRTTLESTELKVVFTSQGGAIESVQHKNAFESDGVTPFDQILPVDPRLLMGQIDDTGTLPNAAPGAADRREMAAGPMRLPELQWTRDEAAETATPEADVIFTFRTAAGLTYHKRWRLPDGEHRYDLKLQLWVTAESGDATKSVDIKLLAASGHLRESIGGAFSMPNGVVYRVSSAKDLSDSLQWGLGLTELSLEGRNQPHLSIFGTRSPYFLTLYYDAPGETHPPITSFWATGEDARANRSPLELNLEDFYKERRDTNLDDDASLDARVAAGVLELNHCWLGLRLPVGDKERSDLSFYVGPIERSTLRLDAYSPPLDSVLTYPNAPDFVADILLWIYDFWRGLFGSAGLAVILMTLCVRGGMMPLSVRNQLSMRRYGRKVAKLKPKVKVLQERYANNPKKLREEQMKLYRENKVGFPAGCLMMLVQIPVFFSLFSSLRVEYSIRGSSFLWIKDLSGPDKLIDFGERIVDLGFFWMSSLNVLPLLMVGLSIMHTRNMPKPADEQQAQQMKMMKWLPIVFAVILYNYTAALALYMVLSSAVAIIESKIVRAKDDAEQAAPPEKA